MSSERPEFRPIESAPARPLWPYAILGAVIVGLVVYIARQNVKAAEARPVALATVAPKIEAAKEAPKPTEAPASTATIMEKAKAAVAESPNVLGAAAATATKLAMVARSELDREAGRTRAAQKQADVYKRQVEDLNKQLTDARAQIAALQKTRQPPPPSDQEQILQMLAPVLRTSNDGRP
jgi:hypothetical protein